MSNNISFVFLYLCVENSERYRFMVEKINSFDVLKYKNANGVDCSARKVTLPNGMQVVTVQRGDLPKDKAEMMSLDTFMKEELPNVQPQVRHQGDEFKKQ